MNEFALYRDAEMDSWRFRPSSEVVATIRDGDHLQLVNFSARKACVLDTLGMKVWSRLETGCTARQMIRALCGNAATPKQDLWDIHRLSSILIELLDAEMIWPSKEAQPDVSSLAASA